TAATRPPTSAASPAHYPRRWSVSSSACWHATPTTARRPTRLSGSSLRWKSPPFAAAPGERCLSGARPVTRREEGDEVHCRWPQASRVDRDVVLQRIGPIDAEGVLKEAMAPGVGLVDQLARRSLAHPAVLHDPPHAHLRRRDQSDMKRAGLVGEEPA